MKDLQKVREPSKLTTYSSWKEQIIQVILKHLPKIQGIIQ